MKKVLAIFLLAAMCLLAFVGCTPAETATSSEDSVSVDPNASYKDENGSYRPLAAAKDQNGRSFTIIVRGASAGTYQSDDFTTDSEMYGDLINDAVAERNNQVEADYNVKLNVIKSDTINEDIRLDCTSALGSYDAVMPTLSFLSTLASEGYLYDLTTIEGFDLDAPWWDSHCTEAFSINNKVYFTTGDITILNKVNTPSILFNREMITAYGLDNPFELVRSGNWTFDKMVEMAKAVTSIKTSDGSYSADNIYGMVSAYGDALDFYLASGESICAKNADDMPYIAIGGTRSVTIAQKVLSTLTQEKFLIFAQECEAPIWETSFEIFYGGRALFRLSAFSATTKLRKLSQINFGIVPVPLMDETQDQFYTSCGTGETAGIAIPVCVSDPEYSAYMIQAYAAYAKNTITHAYYDINLLYRDVRDDESAEMLDIIFGNIRYDLGEVYDFGGLSSMFNTLVQNRSTDIVSAIESRKDSAELAIENVLDMYTDK